jgi:methionyl-tRNA synthetase
MTWPRRGLQREAFVGRLNADLANDLGSLASRATTMIVRSSAGPSPAGGGPTDGAPQALAATRRVDAAMGEFAFQRALARRDFIGRINRSARASRGPLA